MFERGKAKTGRKPERKLIKVIIVQNYGSMADNRRGRMGSMLGEDNQREYSYKSKVCNYCTAFN